MAFLGVSCQGEFKNTKTTTAIIAPKKSRSRVKTDRPTFIVFCLFLGRPLIMGYNGYMGCNGHVPWQGDEE
jgi:hypothetical protein